METILILRRPADTDVSIFDLNLAITWRRHSLSHSYDWNFISIPMPELTFFPFAPRVLAGVPTSLPIDIRRISSPYAS